MSVRPWLLCKDTVFPECPVAKNPELTAQEPCTQRCPSTQSKWLLQDSLLAMVLPSKRMLPANRYQQEPVLSKTLETCTPWTQRGLLNMPGRRHTGLSAARKG